MSRKSTEALVEKIEKIVVPAAEEFGLELVDVEYLQDGGYWYVRVYIEKEDEEISLEDCSKLSSAVEDAIDKLIEEKFFLEVSSPGLERPLKKEQDYERFTGKKARLILKHKMDDSRNWSGVIEKYTDGTVFLNAEGKLLEIPFSEIKKANLVFEFEDL